MLPHYIVSDPVYRFYHECLNSHLGFKIAAKIKTSFTILFPMPSRVKGTPARHRPLSQEKYFSILILCGIRDWSFFDDLNGGGGGYNAEQSFISYLSPRLSIECLIENPMRYKQYITDARPNNVNRVF